MEPGFPPRSPIDPTAVLMHLALLGLLVLSIAGLFFKSGRRAQLLDLFLWAGVIVLTPVLIAAAAPDHSAFQPFVTGYTLVVWGVAGTAIVRSVVSLNRKGQAVPAGCVIGSLLALGLLIVIMLPSVPSAREAARRSMCKNNLKQIGMAFHNWHEVHGRFPDVDNAEEGDPPLSWRVATLPLIKARQLREDYTDTQPWDDAANLPVSQKKESTWQCPTVPSRNAQDSQQRYFTAYVIVAGPESAFPNGKGLSVREITDGTSNTLLVTEAVGLNIVWTEPRDFDTATEPIGVNLKGDVPTHSPGLLSSYHDGGAHAIFADGSTRFLSERMDPRVLKAIATANAGDDVGDW